jgi:hypothetical protein
MSQVSFLDQSLGKVQEPEVHPQERKSGQNRAIAEQAVLLA